MERCLFLKLRSHLQILIDVQTHESNWPTVTTQDRQWRPVTAHSQVSSSLIGNSALRESLDHSTRIYLQSGSVSLFPFSFLSLPSSSQPASPTRSTEVQRAVHGLTQTSRPDLTKAKHHTYHRRSSIGDHDHPLQASSVDAQLWAYAHISSNEHSRRCSQHIKIDLILSCPAQVGLYPSESTVNLAHLPSFPRHCLYYPASRSAVVADSHETIIWASNPL
jgi:hypothetical protein